MSTFIRYFKGLNTYIEHKGQIDFRESPRHCHWQIMTFVPMTKAGDMADAIAERGIAKRFICDSRVISVNTICLIFKPICLSEDENLRSRRNLLTLLTNKKLKIVWKEDNHGYEIDRSGRIKRSWELRPKPVVKPVAQSNLPFGPEAIQYDY